MKAKKTHSVAISIGMRRNEIAAAISILIAASIIWYGLVPFGRSLWGQYSTMRQELAFAARAESIPSEIKDAQQESAIIDSLLSQASTRRRFENAQALEEIYRIADSAGCEAAKVQIADPIVAGEWTEIPILVSGEATYGAIGRFIEGIENLEYAVRIRQTTMNAIEKKGRASLSLDFVIIE